MLRFVAGAMVAAMVSVSSANAADCKLQKVVDLPVTMVGTRPTVPAKINGRDVTFIADSGAFYSTLSNTIAKELNLPLEFPPFNLRVSGVGGEANIMLTRVKTFTFADAPIPNIEFIVSAGAGGAGSAGLLGQNIWGIADVEYDLGDGAIRMFKPHDCGDLNLAYWADGKPYNQLSIIYGEETSKKVFADAYVNGQRLRVIFDSGASTSVMTLRAAARVGLKPDGPGVRRAGVSGGVGSRALRNWIGPVESFKIGDEEIKNTQLRFGELELDRADMLLGADFFLSHRIYVANSQHRVYFTYNGGPVFNLNAQRPAEPDAAGPAGDAPPAAANSDEPKTADAYSRRGAALAGRHDYEHAVADFTKAIELDPANPRYPYQRAMARLSLKQPLQAMADIEQTLKLKPDDTDALLVRAELRLGDRDRKGAAADLDAISALVSKPADVRLQLARLYAQMTQYDRALAEFDLWIGAHEDDHEMAGALAGRCRVRALANLDPDKAMADCNRAIRLGPPTAAMYDSRALLELRAGDLDRAIEDYNRVLTLNNRAGAALYGRGVARLRKGMKAEGDADIAAALAINPRLSEMFTRYGVQAPSAETAAPPPQTPIH
jgi:tetratricopeptide (TPR) repeat protein